MRWKQTGSNSWGLFDTADFNGMPVEARVAVVREHIDGVTTRRYQAWVNGNNLFFAGKKAETQHFTTLQDAQLWAQTTYRLTT